MFTLRFSAGRGWNRSYRVLFGDISALTSSSCGPHSEHRFAAPSSKEGCRKPVLGVCLHSSPSPPPPPPPPPPALANRHCRGTVAVLQLRHGQSSYAGWPRYLEVNWSVWHCRFSRQTDYDWVSLVLYLTGLAVWGRGLREVAIVQRMEGGRGSCGSVGRAVTRTAPRCVNPFASPRTSYDVSDNGSMLL